jgi:UDP-N-acetylglucosamine--N-acetylmuramyl-(pentapeptide) pyrophosphoryl-undecaprenol N-acetylglucosamine transferase
VSEFVDDMAEAYSWADLVVCRAGALTVSELMAAGVASVLVPFPFAVDDHQTVNARFLSDAGAACLMQQNELNPDSLSTLLRSLLGDRARLHDMAGNAYRLAMRDSTRQVADICEGLAA